MNGIRYRVAVPGDGDAVRRLLEAEGLPTEDLAGGGIELVVAGEGDRLVGCVGVEVAGEDALLRCCTSPR